MYSNPLIALHAGIYIKEDPACVSNLEVFELRPDLLVAWAVVPITNDNYFEDLLFHGRWSVSHDTLSLWLTDEDEADLIEMNFHWKAGEWVSESNPLIFLRKRSGVEYISGPFYYDLR